MTYKAKDFKHLLGLNGFSNELLNNHFVLYEGYVKNTNKVSEKLEELSKEGLSGTPSYAELKRRFGWEFNGMRLHELYFGNLISEYKGLDSNSDLAKKINENFGSVENWEKDFKAAGALRGIGWTALVYDADADKLFNIWINEHDAGYLAGAKPILVMDVFEHAFITDYGLKRTDYIEAFIKAINWQIAHERFNK